jgi:hypothetical protein
MPGGVAKEVVGVDSASLGGQVLVAGVLAWGRLVSWGGIEEEGQPVESYTLPPSDS